MSTNFAVGPRGLAGKGKNYLRKDLHVPFSVIAQPRHRVVICRSTSPESPDVTQAAEKTQQVTDFLKALKGLGALRWIVVGDGGILESVQHYDDVKVTTIAKPSGPYELVTLSQVSKEFECHINLGKLATIEMASSKARNGDWLMHAVRFKDAESKALATALLPGLQGRYKASALDKWTQVKQQFGELQQF